MSVKVTLSGELTSVDALYSPKYPFTNIRSTVLKTVKYNNYYWNGYSETNVKPTYAMGWYWSCITYTLPEDQILVFNGYYWGGAKTIFEYKDAAGGLKEYGYMDKTTISAHNASKHYKDTEATTGTLYVSKYGNAGSIYDIKELTAIRYKDVDYSFK